MKRKFITVIVVCCVSAVLMSTPAAARNKVKKQEKKEQLETRIDFGNAYITGQSLKSGAVYLLQRKKNDIASMMKYREHYRDEIMDYYNLNPRPDIEKNQDK